MLVISQILLTIGAAFISEDLTLIGVALLIRGMHMHPAVGLTGAFLGIFLGDLALWALGRFLVKRALTIAWVARRLPADRMEDAAAWFDRNGLLAMIAARFVPGARLPMYFAAGVIGRNPGKIIGWTFLAALVWTPLFVGAVVVAGEPLLRPLQHFFGGGWIPILLLAIAAYLALRLALRAAGRIFSRDGRRLLHLRFRRLARYEFWPTWLFYLPLLPYFAWLALRYGGLSTMTAANPAIPAGGIVDESKADILSRLPREWVLDFALIPSGGPSSRLLAFERLLDDRSWKYPLIFKPDNGLRGASVRLIRDGSAAADYLADHAGPVLVQVYHPGPFEAGLFYCRLPTELRGHLFSITDKQFPVLTGNGRDTFEQLLWAHPRYSLQAPTFLQRHATHRDRILARGERFPLALAGNHCQGTLFRDGARLFTPALEARIDAIARHFPGFYFGRFDVRYADPAAFMAGADLAIVELNGITSESTNLYDPSWSLLRAYRTLAATWRIAFAIGSLNRRAGHRPTPPMDLLCMLLRHYRHTRPAPLSD